MAINVIVGKKSAPASGIAAAAARLNKVTNEAAAQVQEVERWLSNDCSVGVYAAVRTRSFGDETGVSSEEWLCYSRTANRSWRIVVTIADEHGEDLESKPWSDWDRDTKLETFPYLPRLLEELAKKVTEQADKAEAAMAEVRKSKSLLTGGDQ